MDHVFLRGPFNLEDDIIDREVDSSRPGVFLLGGSGTFRVEDAWVGRSDIDVNNQLHVYVGLYPYFRFQYASSSREAFEMECRLFHEVRPPDNPVHPKRPSAATWQCPRCDLFR